jgi:hypothetical protein
MRMHSRPSTHQAPARAKTGSIVTSALPLLLAATGMLLIGTALILDIGLLVLAGAGIVVIAVAVYGIAAGLDRSDRRHAQGTKAQAPEKIPRGETGLPPRGELADAAVDALTRTDGPGGVWPPLSHQQAGSQPTRSPPAAARSARAAPDGQAVNVWEPHGKVTPRSFEDPSTGPGSWPETHEGEVEQEALMEFQAATAPTQNTQDTNTQLTRPQPQWDPPAPTQAPAPQERDMRVWPGASGLGNWDHLSRQDENQRMSETRRAASMKERRDRLAERLPTVGAILASPTKDDAPPKSGATRGKCSSCENYLWAPPQRPITLKCPSCGHKARLY